MSRTPGNYYRWRYKSTEGMFDPYWCKAQIALVTETGVLRDIYWSYGGEGFVLPASNVYLEFICNEKDLEPGQFPDAHKKYAPADIVRLVHPNDPRNTRIRKGAKPDLQAQLDFVNSERKKAEETVRYWTSRVQQLEEERDRTNGIQPED